LARQRADRRWRPDRTDVGTASIANSALGRAQIVRIARAQWDEVFGFASRRRIESKNVVTSISTWRASNGLGM
jgi:hypothetical protein